MPRTGRRRSLTTAAALLAMLAAPAAAQAATYTVKAGDGPCGAADLGVRIAGRRGHGRGLG